MGRSLRWMMKEFLGSNYFKNGKTSNCANFLLWDRGSDLTGKSVVQGRERLEEIITPVDGIQVGGYLEKRGETGSSAFQLAKEKGFEGIIAKRKTSVYRPGKRSPRLFENQITPTARIRRLRIH